MAIRSLCVRGYRSIRCLQLPLEQVNVIVGPNGCGKTNLYRSMYLLGQAAEGRLAAAILAEGGMPSLLWAGDRRQGPVRMQLEVRTDMFLYEIALGLATDRRQQSYFNLDPVIKEERLYLTDPHENNALMLQRANRSARTRDMDGNSVPYQFDLLESEVLIAQIQEPHRYPELSLLRYQLSQWRFYHQFRTDLGSPIRQPQPGTITPVLGHDGQDLAAALATIFEIGDGDALAEAVADAFHSARIEIAGGPFAVLLQMPGIRRAFTAQELSDGTLRFLCLTAALLSPRPPTLIAMNEPETSLHPDLLAPLARLIARASQASQVWITTHSRLLAEHIAELTGCAPVELEMSNGETRVVGSRVETDDADE